MLDWVFYVLLFLFLLAGVAITFITLPGLWLMLLSATIYAIATHFHFISWKTLLVLLVMALLGEIVEVGYSGRGAKRAGAGRRGLWGAIIGGVLGGFVLSFVLPFGFPLSTILGICIGTFAGATLGELSAGQSLSRSALIGLSATTGRVMGTILKGAIGGAMLILTLWIGLPIHHKTNVVVIPATQPAVMTTAPTTRP